MSNAFRLKSGTALLLALGLSVGAFTPMITAAPVVAQTQTQTQFTDVSSGYWAREFITSLAARNIIAGFPDGTFRPDEPVTRAQFAAMVRQAFSQSSVRSATSFVDVPANYWAAAAIREANMMGFLSGYPGNVFRPDENIPRAQVLVSLSNGLNYTASSQNSVQVYRDASQIPQYAVASLAAATERRMVVNYPDVQALRPNQIATRADVAAFIYQALASQNQVATINSPYIVGQQQAAQPTVPAGTVLSVAYENGDKVVVLPEETSALTLNVAQAVTDSSGRVLIPAGSQVVGELRPSANGSQFVAQELVLPSGQRMAINATSQTVTTTETIRQGATLGETLAGAVLGSGAAAAIARTTGDQSVGALEVLAGTATGATLSRIFGRNRVEVITINPARDLSLTVNAPLTVSAR
ncbi:S-layer homology domain-containing protein [Nodosilinea sp. LEGE 06152]|uniref:S-layer homology domain-containing protein n=1 Tax=Nodosilinea sp. LEGE 06152 TaxID=2777966 RepID=UPI00187F5919|nr:S-layer homology domain-containing protein [Nodosilinea sp. LEGE 06152]MBE9157348.1 S-layer homology domain-containing protein [Nodosilinea sp. LEGE 06152]